MGNNIKLAITGDFSPVYNTETLFKKGQYADVFGDFTEAVAGTDLHITNLECPLTNSNTPILKNGPPLRAVPESVNGLLYAKVDIACLANNHVRDYGDEGVADTIKVCKDSGIKTVGAGANLDEAKKILYVSVKNKKIAIVNIAEHEFTIATENNAGANPLNLPDNFRLITEAKKNADFVMMISHGGNEYYELPSPRMVENYRFFADAGADVVIGHHPHCCSGYEVHNGVPIFYSLGNFIFDWDTPRLDSWFTGCLLVLDMDENDGIKFELQPFYQSKRGIGFRMMKGDERQAFLKHLDDLSEIIADKAKLKKAWSDFCNAKRGQYYYNLFGLNKVTKRLFKMPFLKQMLVPKRKKIALLNMIDCEAHKDVVTELLNNDIKN